MSSAAQTFSATANLNPESCISLASNLRCYYTGRSTEIHHSLLIIPVVLELIFSISLVFICWHSGRRHLLLVAEGGIVFLLSLIEAFLCILPAVRDSIPIFRAVDELIGALSFIQLLFYMSFLYAWVQGQCFPIVPRKFRKIAKLLLLMFIPTVIAVNMIASFVGVSYAHGPNHVTVTFRDNRARFVWPFFSSITLALFALFQASCLCFACYRLIIALLVQRQIEVKSKDAAVLFRGIGWINIGIKFGVIETATGFLFFGIPIAYVRRALRMLSRAFLCIGVAKGTDAIEDFKAFRDQLASKSPEWNFQRHKSRQPISNPYLRPVRQSLPRTTVPHVAPQESAIDYNLHTRFNEEPHLYAANAFLTAERRNSTHENMEPLIPAPVSKLFPKLSMITDLSGVSDFVKTRTGGMFERSPRRITTNHRSESPASPLRYFRIGLPATTIVTQNIEYRHRSVSATSHEWCLYNVAPAHSNTHESMNESPGTLGIPTVAPYDHTQSFGQSSFELEPPTPAYFEDSTWRLSNTSRISDISATQAEIVDISPRTLSFTNYKSSLVKPVLYSVPGSEADMVLSGAGSAPTTQTPQRYLQKPRPALPEADRTAQFNLSNSRRPYPSRSSSPVHHSPVPVRSSGSQSTQQRAKMFARGSIIDEDDIALLPIDEGGYGADRKADESITLWHDVDSAPEMPQAIREFAMKFPGPPSEAPVADIGFHSSGLTPVKERHVAHFMSGQSRVQVESVANLIRHSKTSLDSMDTIEMLRTRIPAELKMKGRAACDFTDTPLPPIPGQEVQQLPQPQPMGSAPRLQPLRKLPSPGPRPALVVNVIDRFDSDTSSPTIPNELSMLRHLQSIISAAHPTRHNSGTMTFASSVLPLSHNPNPHITLSTQPSLGVTDFGTALNEWNATGQRTSETSDLPSVEMTKRYERDSSVQDRAELGRQQERQQQVDSTVPYDVKSLDDLPGQFYQLRQPQNADTTWAPSKMNHIISRT